MRATIPLFAALALSSCARSTDLPTTRTVTPRVTFQAVDVEALRANDLDTSLALTVHNPYRHAISMEPMSWTLELAGAQTLTGTTEGARFDDRRAASLTIPIRRDWEQLAPAVAAVGASDNIPFRLTASAVFDTPNGPVEVPVVAEGQIPVVLPPPDAELVDVREIEGGELPSLQVLLDTEGFPRDAGRLNYRIWLGYDLVTDGATTATWLDDRLALGVVVDAPALLALREGADLRIEVTTDVRTPYGVVPVVLNAGGVVDLDEPRL